MSAASPSDNEIHKRIASRCNDAAWALIEKPDLTPGDSCELVRLAGAASYHWGAIGAARNIALADLLLGWSLARAGAGMPAVDAASRALSYFTGNPSKDWERAFAHAAMARRATIPQVVGRDQPVAVLQSG